MLSFPIASLRAERRSLTLFNTRVFNVKFLFHLSSFAVHFQSPQRLNLQWLTHSHFGATAKEQRDFFPTKAVGLLDESKHKFRA